MEEIWRDINGQGLYQASSLGRIKSLEKKIVRSNRVHTLKERILEPHVGFYGYKVVNLVINGIVRSVALHRVITETFIPNPENKRTINHKNKIKTDNQVENLEWCSDRENVSHAIMNKKKHSRYIGVTWDITKSLWVVRVRINGTRKFVGTFKDEYLAGMAYKQFLQKNNIENKYAKVA
jgi:hypothetical protein